MFFSKRYNARGRSLSLCHWDLYKHINVPLTHALFLNVLYHHFLDLDQKPDNSVWNLHSKANVLTGI